ncbi:MAG: hypothetical protein DMG67_00560 [Acidobacteria bacterium]|nr:MAG: hypothetical protein DMG67_00560 [Acidobacteriota bacterium]
MPAADRTVRDQRIAEVVRRDFCRSRSECNDVREIAVKGGHTSHQRVPRVEGAQRECIALQVRRVAIRIIVAGHPSTVDSVWLAGPIEGKPILHNDPAAIHVVRQVVTQCIRVQKSRIAERHNDLVLLKLTQSGRADVRVEKVNSDHIGLGLDFRLKLSR